MKVDFMIIGSQKCGTSTLFDILKSHPSIVGCNEKEPHYFSKTPDWRRYLSDYEGMFERVDGAIYFEASTSYTFYPILNLNVWDDVYAYNPDMKFIYLVRDPVEKIISAYMHAAERGFETRPIEEAICNGDFLINSTRYYVQISPFISRFGRERVLLIDFDDLIHNRDDVIATTASFLGVSAAGFSDYESTHANASLRQERVHHRFDEPSWHLKLLKKVSPRAWDRITSSSRRTFNEKPQLADEYREVINRTLLLDIKALEKLMEKDLSAWYRDVLETSN